LNVTFGRFSLCSLAEGQRLRSSALRLTQNEDQQQRHQNERDELQNPADDRLGIRVLDVHVDLLETHRGVNVADVGRQRGGELAAVFHLTGDVMARYGHFRDIRRLHATVERRVVDPRARRLVEDQLIDDENHEDEDAEDDQDGFEVFTHVLLARLPAPARSGECFPPG
jgi:hypothetical protein